MPFIPHTEADIAAMLAAIGAPNIEALFDEIPSALRNQTALNIPEGLNEQATDNLLEARGRNITQGACFIGAGAYDHYIPAAVWEIASRGEFLTAYTPYQAEASQGNLQLLYEYQTMIASLTGMEVSNASLYDGASALAEAILMAIRIHRRPNARRVLLPSTLHPYYRQTVKTIVNQQNIETIELPYCLEKGITLTSALKNYSEEVAAIVIPQPNFFGCLEEVDYLTDWAHHHNALAIACVNPTSLAVLREPGQWGQKGADIVCGEGQPLGIPLASGGPYFGFLCARMVHVREMPGRIVGRTVDAAGNTGFSLTLQAREQHIRRSKATSNICTNQGLLVIAATIYMSLLGPIGLRRVAAQCHANTQQLVTKLTQIPGVSQVFSQPYFHEAVLRLPKPVDKILRQLAAKGILGGYELAQTYPELDNCLLVCATETRTPEDIAAYAAALTSIIANY